MNEKDFFERLRLESTLKNTKYIEFLRKILFNENYETFLFFDEIETKMIRMSFNPDKTKRKTYDEIAKELGIKKYNLQMKFKKIYDEAPSQIRKTLNFYSKNKMPIKMIKYFKSNIKQQKLNPEIKKILIDKNIHTLEQLFVQNPIDWKNESIRTITKVANYFGEPYKNATETGPEQELIQKLDFTNEELNQLEQNRIRTVNDIKNLTFNDVEDKLILTNSLKEKIKKNINLKHIRKGFFKDLSLPVPEDCLLYVDLLEGILQDNNYKTFLYLDEIDTKIIRLRFKENGEINLTYKQISEEVGIYDQYIAKRLENIRLTALSQIRETYRFYKKYEMPKEMIKYFKKNIQELNINSEIKNFIIENGMNTLEQLVVQNPVAWNVKSIRTIKQVTEYFEKSGIEFPNKKYEQKIISSLELTKEELDELENNKIITFNDIYDIGYNDLKLLNISNPLKEKIKNKIQPSFNRKGFFQKIDLTITQENIDYIDYIEKIIFDNNYKTFLFFDELDTKILRAYYNEQGEKLSKQAEINKILGIPANQVIQRLKKMFFYTPMQIEKTFKFYKNNNVAQERIDFFKKNIDEIDIDSEIKKIIIENKLNTLEQLIIPNIIKWNDKPIKTIKKMNDILKKEGIDFKYLNYEQKVIKKINPTYKEIITLEKNGIIIFDDLYKLEYNNLESLGISEKLQKKIKKYIELEFHKKGFFKEIDVNITQENAKYMDYLETILFDKKYKTFLFFDELETELIRLHYNKKGEINLTIAEISNLLRVSEEKINKIMNNIFKNAPSQINETFEFYKKYKMTNKMIEPFKANIEDISINEDIKNFIIKNNVKTLEQLLIQNPINWGKNPINDIKKVTEYFEKSKVKFEILKPEQAVILELSKSTIITLEKNGIKKFNDIYNIGYKEISSLNIPNNLKNIVRNRIEKRIKNNEFFKELGIEITQENVAYMNCLEKTLFNSDRKTFLYLDELSTQIIRLRYDKEGKKKLSQKTIGELLDKNIMTISNRFAKIFSDVPSQINETFEYYKKNNMSQRMIESFKSNIENVPIDKKIKDFIIENNINTLEQLLIQNPIDWEKQPIRMIKEITEYFELKGINFKNINPAQELVKRLQLTKNEINVLEQENIYLLRDIEKIEFEKLVQRLKLLPVLIRKIRRSKMNLNVKKTTRIETLKIRYWTGQKLILNGIETIGDLIKKTPKAVQLECDLTDGEIESIQFRINELGFEFKQEEKQLKLKK